MNDIHQQLLEEVNKYNMPRSAINLLRSHPPLIISSVTASGKNTVMEYIVKHSDYRHVITHTTRPRRPGEINSHNYWFVDETKMFNLIQAAAFIEAKAIHGETVYGTSIKSYNSVVKTGHKPLLIMDIQGVEELLSQLSNLKPYFILPPSYEDWMNRLHSRGVITEQDKAERMSSARRELQTVLDNPAYILVVNNKIGIAAAKILKGLTDETEQGQNRQLAQKLLDKLK